jgi:1-aminocyclopropane-1-carboxylate synthase
MIWAISKDLGASGVRYAILYSQNEMLLRAMGTMSTFVSYLRQHKWLFRKTLMTMFSIQSSVGGPMQNLISELLTDDQFMDNFLDESRDRLVHSYNICVSKLEEMVLPFVSAEAGMFVYVDFSSLLPEKTYEWEQRLSDLMFEVRVVLTPGESQCDPNAGMFRICYAWVSPEVLEIAMERLSRLVTKLRRMDWRDIDGRVVASVLYG